MMKRLILGVLLALCAWGADINWTHVTSFDGSVPSYGSGYMKVIHDHTSRQTMAFLHSPALSSIYSSGFYFLRKDASTGNWTWTLQPGGYTGTLDAYTLDSPTWPGLGHPNANITYDWKRKDIWAGWTLNTNTSNTCVSTDGSNTVTRADFGSGSFFIPQWVGHHIFVDGTDYVVAAVAGDNASLTVTAGSVPAKAANCGTPLVAQYLKFPSPDDAAGTTHRSWYHCSTSTNIAANVCTQTIPAHVNSQGTGMAISYWSAFEADPFYDIQFGYGFDGGAGSSNNWVYCPTDLNPTPGTLTAKQVQAGCYYPDDVSVVCPGATPNGSHVDCAGTVSQPSASNSWSNLVWDSVTKKHWRFGGGNSGGRTKELWSYDPGIQTWTHMGQGTVQPPLDTLGGFAQYTFNTMTHKLILHALSAPPTDWEYDPATDLWRQLTSTGAGLAYGAHGLAHDPVNNVLIDVGTADEPGVWIGQLQSPSFQTDLTISETLYSGGTAGVDRVDEPWCMGVPIPDSAGITNTSTLGLGGLTGGGQFRLLGTWPSGNAKWIKVCGTAYLQAGQTATQTLFNGGGGSGNFGGPNLATDNGSTITVATGTATFTIKKANFNGIDIATVGSTSILTTSSSATRGLVLTGPSSTASTVITGTVAEPFTIATGVNDTLVVESAGGALPTTVTFTAGSGITAATLAGEISVSGITASASSGHLVLTANTTGRGGMIELFGSSNSLSTLGLVAGAVSGAVTCSPSPGGSPCSTIYSSANDSASTCSIEENGPILAVIACTGTHYDNASHPYMHFTARETFWKNRSTVAMKATIRNADYSTAAAPSADCNWDSATVQCDGLTFNVSNKGMLSYEFRVAPGISGTLNYTVATDTTEQTGTMSGSDFVYLYQGQANTFAGVGPSGAETNYGTTGAGILTPDVGYRAYKNSTSLASGDQTKIVLGYADIRDSSGIGVEIGHYQITGNFPKSLEFDAGGSDVRIGIYPSENGAPTSGPGNGTHPNYVGWPQWDTNEIFLNFHAAALVSAQQDFLRYQHPLVARPASLAYTNSTGVFPYPLVDPAVEDNYYLSLGPSGSRASFGNGLSLSNFCMNSAAPCTPDYAINPSNINNFVLGVYRDWGWTDGGPRNQIDFFWQAMLQFYQRGFTGGMTNARFGYKFFTERAWPHSDGSNANGTDATINHFTWRSRQQYWSGGDNETDSQGFPTLVCTGTSSAPGCPRIINGGNSWVSYDFQGLHNHTWGISDYYYMSGDEYLKDAIVSRLDYYLNPTSAQACVLNGGTHHCLGYTRSIGHFMIGGVHFANYSTSLGNTSDATNITTSIDANYTYGVQPQGCMSGYPAGCTAPLVSDPSLVGNNPYGVSRTRGAHQSAAFRFTWCPADLNTMALRGNSTFQTSILIDALTQYRLFKTPSWTYYNEATGLAFGMSQWSLTEGYTDNGASVYVSGTPVVDETGTTYLYNGFRYGQTFDVAATCSPSGSGPGWTGFFPVGSGTVNTVNDVDGIHTDVTWVSGTTFTTGSSWVNQLFGMFGEEYYITAVIDSTHLKILDQVGTSTATPFKLTPDTYTFGGNIYDHGSVPAGAQTVWHTFYEQYLTTNLISWERKMDNALVHTAIGGSGWPIDFGGYQIGALIYAINSAPTTSLKDVTLTSFSNLGSGQQQFTYTVPAGSSAPVLKWDPLAVQSDLTTVLGYDGITANSFGYAPTSYTAWMAAADVTSQLPSWTTGSHTVTITTGQNGLALANFSLKALQLNGCGVTLSPSSPGPYTATQTISTTTATAVNCGGGTLTWTSSGLPAGLSGCNSVTGTSCTITGTVTTATTYTPTISVSDGGTNSASVNPTIIVNAAPSITTSSPLPAGTVGTLYSQTLVASGGTSPLTWSVSSGTVPTGTSLSSGGVLSGTPSTTTGSPFSFTALVVDSNSINNSKGFNVTINPSGGGGSNGGSLLGGRTIPGGKRQ
jgi:hypothetical protein